MLLFLSDRYVSKFSHWLQHELHHLRLSWAHGPVNRPTHPALWKLPGDRPNLLNIWTTSQSIHNHQSSQHAQIERGLSNVVWTSGPFGGPSLTAVPKFLEVYSRGVWIRYYQCSQESWLQNESGPFWLFIPNTKRSQQSDIPAGIHVWSIPKWVHIEISQKIPHSDCHPKIGSLRQEISVQNYTSLLHQNLALFATTKIGQRVVHSWATISQYQIIV